MLVLQPQAGVADACLRLQDEHGQSVPFLLWAAWAKAQGRVLDDVRLERGVMLARRWEALAVGPLRQVRRGLKIDAQDMAEEAREAIRAQVKAVELAAERALMEALEALTPTQVGPGAGLTRAVAAWGAVAPQGLLLDLMARLA